MARRPPAAATRVNLIRVMDLLPTYMTSAPGNVARPRSRHRRRHSEPKGNFCPRTCKKVRGVTSVGADRASRALGRSQ